MRNCAPTEYTFQHFPQKEKRAHNGVAMRRCIKMFRNVKQRLQKTQALSIYKDDKKQ